MRREDEIELGSCTLSVRELLSLRERAVEGGVRLLSADEVLDEVRRRRRGEVEDDDAEPAST